MTNAMDAVESISDTLTGYVSTAMPFLLAVAVAFIGVWFVPKAIGWIKRVAK